MAPAAAKALAECEAPILAVRGTEEGQTRFNFITGPVGRVVSPIRCTPAIYRRRESSVRNQHCCFGVFSYTPACSSHTCVCVREQIFENYWSVHWHAHQLSPQCSECSPHLPAVSSLCTDVNTHAVGGSLTETASRHTLTGLGLDPS